MTFKIQSIGTYNIDIENNEHICLDFILIGH